MRIVNHVMSSDLESNIFDKFISYIQEKSEFKHITSARPIENADIYHYHRPQLESELLDNSLVTVHHDLFENNHWLTFDKFVDRYKEAKKIVCLNSNQSKFLDSQGMKNLTVIPHGYNDKVFNRFNNKNSFAFEKKINVGLISKRYGRRVKGEAYLYELSKRLDPSLFHFILIGQGRSIEAKFLTDLGFTCDYYDYFPYGNFAMLYEEIDILLMTSFFEGGPANIPEALVSNVPVVGFDVGMVSDFIENNVNGIILSGKPSKDSNTMNKLGGNMERLIESTQVFNSSLDIPTWSEVSLSYENIYKELK